MLRWASRERTTGRACGCFVIIYSIAATTSADSQLLCAYVCITLHKSHHLLHCSHNISRLAAAVCLYLHNAPYVTSFAPLQPQHQQTWGSSACALFGSLALEQSHLQSTQHMCRQATIILFPNPVFLSPSTSS